MATHMQNENETIMFERERRCSSCGGLRHCRRTHSECPLNPANIDGIIQLPALFEVPDNTNISNGRRCASCGGLGHSRRTHQDCPLNSENTQQPQPRMVWNMSNYIILHKILFNHFQTFFLSEYIT
ncbi:hypothetical protein BDA99DRAFT_577574 [Phascolomyces articulosus]|uniref:Uncharacterized protein n=1 Tax=Phascolomyces articulosus TaxID=60185 RepID=A0AAD5JUZ1_9FUNG|nr:hypothetical protein BDA99DRAFT_577574 [Phascolomyces articulosus]